MPVADTVVRSLTARHARFEVVTHRITGSSTDTAEAAHVPGGRLAKGVVLSDAHGLLMVVLPASRHVDLAAVEALTGRRMRVAREAEVAGRFPDCAPGAVPPVGPAYRMDTLVDREVLAHPDVFFEGGDHESLVRMSSAAFVELLTPARMGDFGMPLSAPL
jgi:Ala-tRNA(Pro) deacylase